MEPIEKWVEVFKVGIQIDSSGRRREFTEDLLDEIIDEYNSRPESGRKAPVIKGHEENGQPKFGEVVELKRENDIMYALVQTTNEEFIQDVRNGEYDAVSIAINGDDTFRHLAVLGAENPAVIDLEPFTLSKEEKLLSMNFSRCNFIDKIPTKKKEFKNRNSNLTPTIENITLSDFMELLRIHDISANFWGYSKNEPDNKYFSKNYIENWKFAINVPVKDLTKEQLIKVLEGAKGYENNKNNISNKQYEADTMDEILALLFTGLQTEMTTWAEETLSPEVATQFSSKFSELKENFITKGVTELNGGTEDTTDVPSENTKTSNGKDTFSKSENSAVAAMQDRIEELEIKDRIAGFNEVINSLISKGILEPKQKESLFNLLSATHKVPVLKFSKGVEKTVNKLILEYTESFGTRLAEGIKFQDGAIETNDSKVMQGEYEYTEAINKYADENKISFREAMKKVPRNKFIN